MILGMAPRVSGSVGLGQGLRMCISSKFPAVLMLLSQDHTVRTTAWGVAILGEVGQ